MLRQSVSALLGHHVFGWCSARSVHRDKLLAAGALPVIVRALRSLEVLCDVVAVQVGAGAGWGGVWGAGAGAGGEGAVGVGRGCRWGASACAQVALHRLGMLHWWEGELVRVPVCRLRSPAEVGVLGDMNHWYSVSWYGNSVTQLGQVWKQHTRPAVYGLACRSCCGRWCT